MDKELSRRWRLILGSHYSEQLFGIDLQRDLCLEELYSYEHKNRQPNNEYGLSVGVKTNDKSGGRTSSIPKPVTWLHSVRKAFPKSSIDILQKHGIEHYGLTELLLDKELLSQQKADINLLQTLLTFRDQIPPNLLDELSRIISIVCQELEEALTQNIISLFAQHRTRQTHSRPMPLSYADWQQTITRNLKHYQKEQELFVLERAFFYQTQKNQIPWDIYLVVDQSGSMLNALIHSSVIATIFARLSMLSVHLYLFDTRVVDFTEHAQDALQVLLNVQLGGGTDIAQAMAYTQERITSPSRSMVVLISDFYEGGSPNLLYQKTKEMAQDGVTLLGLTALDCNQNFDYDTKITKRLLDCGMEIASMTPEHLSRWVSQVIK